MSSHVDHHVTNPSCHQNVIPMYSCLTYPLVVQAPPIIPYIIRGGIHHHITHAHPHHHGWEESLLLGIDARPWCYHSQPPLPVGIYMPASFQQTCDMEILGLPTGRWKPLEDMEMDPDAPPLIIPPTPMTFPQLILNGLLTPWVSIFGSPLSCLQIPDFGRLISDSGKLSVLDRLLSKLHAEGMLRYL